MISPDQVSAVLVTRGNVPMDEILGSIKAAGIQDIVIWNNAQRPKDLSCYGRYAGICDAKNPIIYHQDDDLVVPVGDLLAEYDEITDWDTVVANNRADEEWRLIGIGSLFNRDMADCFDDYQALYGFDADFCRVADVVFAYQHPYRRVVLGYRDLPWGTDPSTSMYFDSDHMSVRMRARIRTLALPVAA